MNMVAEASKFLNIIEEEVNQNIKNATETSIKDWKNKKSIEDFYKTTDFYIYGCIRYNTRERLENILFYTKCFNPGLDILDFGAGIGTVGFLLAKNHNIDYYDVESRTKEFAMFLNKKVEHKINFLNEKEVYEKKYDVIFLLDVLEHLVNPMETFYKIHKLLKPGGLLMTTGMIFSINKSQPMHLPDNTKYVKEFNEFIRENYRLKYFIHGIENVHGVEKK